MYKNIDVVDYKNYINIWNGKEFIKEPLTTDDRIDLIKTLGKRPGEMKLNEKIFLSQLEGQKFLKTGLYTKLVPKTRDWFSYWEKCKELAYTGMLIDDFYITGSQWFFQNFTPINDKVKRKITLPRIFDTQIWLSHQIELAELTKKFTATVKKRQIGVTLWYLSDMIKDFWFIQGFSGKVCAWDERYVKENWKILDIYRDHLQDKTSWKRPLDPGKIMDWQQRGKTKKGTYVGLKSSLKGITFKNNPAAPVSGKTDKVYVDEGGIAPNALELMEFVTPALSYGNIATGIFHIAGAVGKLKDATPLRKMIEQPHVYNMHSTPYFQAGKEDQDIGIFIPEEWSYGTFIDEYGNSDIKGAKIEIQRLAEEEKKKSYKSYMLYKSQRPSTLEDAFAEREENDFPVHIIQPHYDKLNLEYKPLKVTLKDKTKNIVEYSLGAKEDIVEDFPVNKETDKHGAIVIDEMPHPNAPFGLYYAGVDTITPIFSTSSVSLQTVYIYKAAHEMDGEFSSDKIVAWYAGRPDEVYGAFEMSKNLIKFYNARAGIENDNRNFIEWMIKEKQQKHLMRRNEFPLSKDILARSTISNQEYGIRTGNKSMKEYLISLTIEYVSEEIGARFNDVTGESTIIYGVERIKDKMLLKEMLNYTPKKNVDRIMAFAIALFAAKSNTNRGIKVVSKNKVKPKARYTSQFSRTYSSPFARR